MYNFSAKISNHSHNFHWGKNQVNFFLEVNLTFYVIHTWGLVKIYILLTKWIQRVEVMIE